jgi:hypothetical protein
MGTARITGPVRIRLLSSGLLVHYTLTKRDFTVGGAKNTRNPFVDAVRKNVGKTGLSTEKMHFD